MQKNVADHVDLTFNFCNLIFSWGPLSLFPRLPPTSPLLTMNKIGCASAVYKKSGQYQRTRSIHEQCSETIYVLRKTRSVSRVLWWHWWPRVIIRVHFGPEPHRNNKVCLVTTTPRGSSGGLCRHHHRKLATVVVTAEKLLLHQLVNWALQDTLHQFIGA